MGHQVEYFLKVSSPLAREWLSKFDGFWGEPEATGELAYGEFRLWDDLDLHATLASSACCLGVPQIKYSWLIAEDRKSLTQVDRLERLLAACLPDVTIIRVDEFVRLLWEAEVGLSWQEQLDPVGSLGSWLMSSKQDLHYYNRVSEGDEYLGGTSRLE